MTLPVYPNPISLWNVSGELGVSQDGLDFDHPRVRLLAGKPSGPISLADLHGKTRYAMVAGYYEYTPPSEGLPDTAVYIGFGVGRGSLSPSTVSGASVSLIEDAFSQNEVGTAGPRSFRVRVSGVRAKTFFSSIHVNGTTFLTAAASFSTGSSDSIWSWPTGANLTNGVGYDVYFN